MLVRYGGPTFNVISNVNVNVNVNIVNQVTANTLPPLLVRSVVRVEPGLNPG